MDIHKPKAAHSWREFLVEIGTIICGILIALSLEQGVEWLHRQREVAETREALKRELSDNLKTVRYARAENQCLLGIGQRLVGWAKGGPRPVMTHRATLTGLQTNVWEFSKNGPVARMPLEEGLAFARYYNLVEGYNANAATMRQIGVRTVSLSALDKLSTAQAERLIEENNSARALEMYQIDNAGHLIRSAQNLGAEMTAPSARAKENIEALCKEAGVPAPEF